jgi:hypothetical protein
VNAEQAAFEIDARSANERYADEYRASLAARTRHTGEQSARVGGPDGFALATATILRLLTERGTVTADDVEEDSPIRSNAIGSAFGALAREGRIAVVGYVNSRRPEAHGRIQRVWGRGP